MQYQVNLILILAADETITFCVRLHKYKILIQNEESTNKLEKGRICGQMLDVSTDKGQLT